MRALNHRSWWKNNLQILAATILISVRDIPSLQPILIARYPPSKSEITFKFVSTVVNTLGLLAFQIDRADETTDFLVK